MKKEHNIMETMNLRKLSIKMATPMVISMLSLALYNLVDSIFVANIGLNALTAISLSYPIQAILIAISLGTSIGVNSLISRKLGEKDNKKANETAMNGIFLISISYLIILIFAYIFLNPIIHFFTTDKEIVKYALIYLSTCITFSFGLLYQILFEKISEAYGKPSYSMIIQISGAILNLILDPLLIYGWKFIPSMGIKGAAIATVTGQIFGMILGIKLLNKKYINFKFRKIKPNKELIKQIYQVGIPTITSESLSAFVSLVLNKLLISFSVFAVPLWGIYDKVQSLIFMIAYGFNYGMIPIVGYNYGAKNYGRMKSTIKLFLLDNEVIMLLWMMLLVYGGNLILNIYGADAGVIDIGILAFKTLSISFVFEGISLVISSVFQATGKGTYSLIIFLFRKIIINIPVIFFLTKYKTIDYVWYTILLSTIIASIISIILYNKERKKLI